MNFPEYHFQERIKDELRKSGLVVFSGGWIPADCISNQRFFPDIVVGLTDGARMCECIGIEVKADESLQSLTQAIGQCMVYQTACAGAVAVVPRAEGVPHRVAEVAGKQGVEFLSIDDIAEHVTYHLKQRGFVEE